MKKFKLSVLAMALTTMLGFTSCLDTIWCRIRTAECIASDNLAFYRIFLYYVFL